MSCRKLDVKTRGNHSFIKTVIKDPDGAGCDEVLETLDAFEKSRPDLRVIFFFFQYSFSAKMLGDIPCSITGIWVRHQPKKSS